MEAAFAAQGGFGRPFIARLLTHKKCLFCSVTNQASLLRSQRSRVGIPNAISEQAIKIGEIRIAAAVEAQPFAILLAGPFAIPYLPSRIIAVEVRTAER